MSGRKTATSGSIVAHLAAVCSAPEQLDELLNSEAGVGDDATERAGPELFVIGYNHPCVGLVATKHHMTAALAAKNEAGAL
jgi:hypothetical protein